MEIQFKNKTALVTGAGQGIGRAIAKRLLEHGATVYALSKTLENLLSLQKEAPGIKVVHVDLEDWKATRKCLEEIGQIDLLVNNAGINILESFLDIQEESFDKIFNVNLKAVINVSQVIAKKMIDNKVQGSIVNISSQASQGALKNHTVYCGTKAALDMVSKVMALELGQHKIRVNCVNPTVVWTDLGKLAWSDPEKSAQILSKIPLERFVEVEEVVDSVMFLLSERASMITGVSLPVDGGLLVG